MTKTIIKEAIENVLSVEQLKTLHAGLSAHQEEYRLRLLTKHIFLRDINASCEAKKAMEMNTKAIEAAVAFGFYTNYFTENSTLDWISYTAHMVKATDA